ncbi:MAG: alpha-mannosidase [Phycisphaerae bacterium]
MTINIEWKHRLEAWLGELKRQWAQPLQDVALTAFVTTDQLTAEQAERGDFQPIEPGTPWGGKWEYAWFRVETEIPADAAGRRVHLLPGFGGAGTLWFQDGVPISGREWAHQGLCLTRNAQGGEIVSLLAEVYAGHGPRCTHAGPVPPGRGSVPECPETQQTLGRTELVVWDDLAYELWVDVMTLWELRDQLNEDSLRVLEIDRGLKDFTLIVDFEQPLQQRRETYQAARDRLAALMECANGSTAPTLYGFGHGHLDVAWLWPLAETERKVARTMTNQLSLCEEYPEHGFLQPQPHLYRMLQRNYPKLYEQVKRAVADGNVYAEGGSWVEMDTNIPSGESLVRQFLHGKRFFRDEMGVESEMLWLPDVFGYSAALPQILRGCGVKFFSTMKIFWHYHGGDKFPYNTFVWEGIDGSEVYTHVHTSYNMRTTPQHTIGHWRGRVQKDGVSSFPIAFGHGDGGGGPERDHLAFAKRQKDLEGCPRFRFAHPLKFFRDQLDAGWPDARYVGELYFQAHRGVLTSQAKTKKGNRKCELALREAEMWGTIGAIARDMQPDPAELDESWKTVLLNQFHDILPGSSIARVYAEAEAQYADVLEKASQVRDEGTRRLVKSGEGLCVFNSLGWSRRVLVDAPQHAASCTDPEGNVLCSQRIGDRTVVETAVPSCGWVTLQPTDETRLDCDEACGVSADGTHLENNRLRVELNSRGEIVSLFDKGANRESAAGVCNELRMYKDVPSRYDAWDIDSMYTEQRVDLPGEAEIEVIATGPLVATVRVTRTLNRSKMVQDISLRRNSRRVDFNTRIEWNEDHKLLKVAFPVTVQTEELISEIQYGHVGRPNHKSRPYDANRFEVCNHKWSALAEENRGVAVLNDCKYGVSAEGNTMMLTLLKSPKAPDQDADKGTQEFTYSVMPWSGPLVSSGVVQEGYDLNVPVLTRPGDGGTKSMLQVSEPNIIIDTVKPAEDGSGDVIVRLYESARTATRCKLTTSLPAAAACETDMLENEIAPLEVTAGTIALDFSAFQVRTIRLSPPA